MLLPEASPSSLFNLRLWVPPISLWYILQSSPDDAVLLIQNESQPPKPCANFAPPVELPVNFKIAIPAVALKE